MRNKIYRSAARLLNKEEQPDFKAIRGTDNKAECIHKTTLRAKAATAGSNIYVEHNTCKITQ